MEVIVKLFLFIFLSIVTNFNYQICAQSELNTDKKLLKKIQELETKIQEIELRLISIEKKMESYQTQKVLGRSDGNYKIKNNWRALQQGMTKTQVLELLGEPDKISKLSYGGEIWYYGYGNVKFTSRLVVDGWSEP